MDKRPIRIGIDARLYYYQPAGIGLYTKRLLEALAALDDANLYVVLQSRKENSALVRAPNLQPWPLWTPPHHRLEQVTLPLELARLSLDLLHSPDFIPPFRWRGPVVITVMDLAFLRYPYLLTTDSLRYYGQIQRAVRRAQAILAISHSTRQDLIDLLAVPPEKVTVTHLAAGPEFQPVTEADRLAAVRQTYGLPQDFVLFVGTIEPRKNLKTLLQAWTLLPGDLSHYRLVIAGRKGWLHEEVFRLMNSLHLNDAVRFIGAVRPEDLPALYSAARLFVLPSLYEGFGLPVLEAMACGTPVVCSNTSSLPEVAGDAALLVSPDDPVAMAQAIAQALTDETLRAQLVERGLKRAAAFSWSITARQTLEVYRTLT